MWQLVLLFGFPAVVLAFCYIRVILILWISTRQLQTMTSPQRSYGNWRSNGRDNGNVSQRSDTSRFLRNKVPSTPGEEALLARRQVIKMLIVIIAVFLVCWGPKLIIHVMKKFQVKALYTQTSFNLIIALGCLPYIQSCLNPLIYVLMSKAIRKRIYNALSRYCCLCNVLSRSSGRHVNEFVLTNHSATGQTNIKTTLDTYRSYGANEVTDV
ncbi:cholecystokinin receptor-like [Gigantopelta aegis]|uniref:cholecystokinin receptor-like n=1 Tax=Gigantopelta aegis TaxID=1735272 RepID=UPI001B88BD58|nr:cholecystokinin receptor-like [Gigantopelta aegis]